MLENSIKAVIIDDNEDAVALLEIYLQAFKEIQVLESTTNPHKGLKIVKRLNPDIVFLDIDMPEMNGLELGQVIFESELKTEVVFTTAHSQYAFNALNIKPLDYLIKPFGPSEIIAVINRFTTKQKNLDFERRMDFFMRNNKVITRIKLSTKSGVIFVNPEDIIIIRAEGAGCSVFLKDGKQESVTYNISRVKQAINSSNLIKANRSALINLQYLKRIEKKGKRCYLKYNELTFEESINRTGMAYLETINCFPIS